VKIYLGLKEKTKPVIFESEKEPNIENCPQFQVIYGPFKSWEDAERYVNAMGGLACGEG
jgi:hypothetical protein